MFAAAQKLPDLAFAGFSLHLAHLVMKMGWRSHRGQNYPEIFIT